MKTKVVISMSVEIEHPDGTRLRKKVVAAHLKWLLENVSTWRDEVLHVGKAVIRAVDLD